MHPEDHSRVELGLWRRAALSMSAPAVVDGERSWSYGAVAALVAANAARLSARGLTPGDRALIFLSSSETSCVFCSSRGL